MASFPYRSTRVDQAAAPDPRADGDELAALRAIFDHATDQVFLVRVEPDGRFVYEAWNAACERAGGPSREQAVGRTPEECLPRRAAEEVVRRYLRCIADGKPIVMEETMWYEPNGRVWEASLVPIRDASGQITRLAGFTRDVTQRRRAEDGLRAAEEQRRRETGVELALRRAEGELAGLVDRDAILRRLCAFVVEILPCTAAEIWCDAGAAAVLVPTASLDACSERRVQLDGRRVARAAVARLFEGRQGEGCIAVSRDELPAELELLGGADRILCAELPGFDAATGLVVALLADGVAPSPAVQGALRRLTHGARQALGNARVIAELEQLNRLKSDFVATISHELRTPLHVILGYGEMLSDKGADEISPAAADLVRRIVDSTRRLNELISSTLDLSRLESGLLPLDVQRIDVAVLLASVGAEVADLLATPRVELVVSAAADLPVVESDPGRLRVVVKNLLVNAVRFTAVGRIAVRAARTKSGVEIAVEDSGVGIPRDQIEAIFEAFRQGAGEAHGHLRGVGLGLYIVRRLVEQLGGSVAVESEPGRGSTFRVQLPRRLRTGRRG
jgi:PAS domain S-box-containing protein